MLVQGLMTRDVVTVPPDKTALRALQICQEHRIRHLPVVDPSEGKLMGIVSDRDLRDAGPPLGASPARREAVLDRVWVVEMMHKVVITAHPSDLVEQAAREMNERRIGCLPIVSDEGELVGIVTASDILRASVRFWEAVSTMRSIFSPAG
jgi:acetoin utilization protein AcuB